MSCVLFAQCSVDNLSLANAALDKRCGGNVEIHISKPWLPPEAIQAVPSATGFGCATFGVGSGTCWEKGNFEKGCCVCVIWEEGLLFQQVLVSSAIFKQDVC